MPMRDWIARYPRVAALLQQDGDVLEGASVEEGECDDPRLTPLAQSVSRTLGVLRLAHAAVAAVAHAAFSVRRPADDPGAASAACAVCAAPPAYRTDATAYVRHCMDTGHRMQAGEWFLGESVTLQPEQNLWCWPGVTLRFCGPRAALRIGDRTRQARRYRRH